MLSQYLQATITVLSLINPAICIAIFHRSEPDRSRSESYRDAAKASLAVATILVIAALLGTRILRAFGLSLDAFMVAGGIVLSWMGFAMLSAKELGPALQEGNEDGSTLTPLVLFAASPGTITGVITLSAAHTVYEIPVSALIAVGVGTLVLWGVLALTIRFADKASRIGGANGLLSETASRFMGLIVLAMGVQFALEGFRSLMGLGAGAPPGS